MNAALAFEPYTFEQGLEIKLQERYPDSTISIFDVEKNNGVMLRALTIKNPESNISPTIYLDGYSRQYEETHDLDEICDEITKLNEQNAVEGFDVNTILDFERVKGRICAKLVNRTKNAHLIEGAPHRDFLDLTVVYYVCLEQFEGVASILIRNDMLTRWNVDEEEIYTHAMENSPELLPVSFMPIGDVIKSMIESGTVADETFESANNLMYVATNTQRTFGASVLLYPQFLKQVADTVQSDFYVIPSSLHEVLIVPDWNIGLNKEELLAMVKEVNSTTVRDEEFLADNVYFYTRESDEIKALF